MLLEGFIVEESYVTVLGRPRVEELLLLWSSVEGGIDDLIGGGPVLRGREVLREVERLRGLDRECDRELARD